MSPKDDLIPSFEFPSSIKKKAIYFLRSLDVDKITLANIGKVLIYGDISNEPLSQLQLMLENIYIPMLMNKENNALWPEAMTQDLLRQTQRFSSTVKVTIGKMNGQTLLPIPYSIQQLESLLENAQKGISHLSKIEMDLVHDIEASIVHYNRQIKQVTTAQPEDLINNNEFQNPSIEIDFWTKKSSNLLSIKGQLESETIQLMDKILVVLNSTYKKTLVDSIDKVENSLAEAQSNSAYLSPISSPLSSVLESQEVEESIKYIHAIFHILVLVWKYSPYYNTQRRITNFLRLLCNGVIELARTMTDSENVFKVDPKDALDSVSKALELANHFKTLYKHYHSVVESMKRKSEENKNNDTGVSESILYDKDYFKEKREEGKIPQPNKNIESWPSYGSVFAKFDLFCKKLQQIHYILHWNDALVKLQKVEVGGNQGAVLAVRIQEITVAAEKNFNVFIESTYNPTDFTATQFEIDYNKFSLKVDSWVRRLNTVLEVGFNTATNISTVYKLVTSFRGILPDEDINNMIYKKYQGLIAAFNKEIQSVNHIFKRQKDSPTLPDNMPPITGCIVWGNTLLRRLNEPMDKFACFESVIGETGEYKELKTNYLNVKNDIENYCKELHKYWVQSIDEETKQKLDTPLLIRDSSQIANTPHGTVNRLLVNFDPSLTSMLHEVRYFEQLGYDVPPKAAKVYSMIETYRQYRFNLDVMVNQYNYIHSSVIDVERMLIAEPLQQIEEILKIGETELTWNSHGIQDFITRSQNIVQTTYDKVKLLRQKTEDIEKTITKWASIPFVQRQMKKTLVLTEIQNIIKTRINNLSVEAQEFKTHIEIVRTTLDLYPNMKCWKEYSKYLTYKIATYLTKLVISSLDYLVKQVAPNVSNKLGPLIEISLVFDQKNKELVFNPGMEFPNEMAETRTLKWYIESWINEMANIGNKILRPDEEYNAFDTESIQKQGGHEEEEEEKEKEKMQNVSQDSSKSSSSEKEKDGEKKQESLQKENSENEQNEKSEKSEKEKEDNKSVEKEKSIYKSPKSDTHSNSTFGYESKMQTSEYMNSGYKTTRGMQNYMINKILSYKDFILTSPEIQKYHKNLNEVIDSKIGYCKEILSRFDNYKDILKTNQQEYLQRFLKFGKDTTLEGLKEQQMIIDEKEIIPPTLNDFDDQIIRYKMMETDVSQLVSVERNGFLQINVRPAQLTIVHSLTHFVKIFTDYLVDTTSNSLRELKVFIDNANNILSGDLQNADYDTLVTAIKATHTVKTQSDEIDSSWQSKKDVIALLSKHEVSISNEVTALLDSLPDQWRRTRGLSYEASEKLLPAIKTETDNTKKKMIDFSNKLLEFKQAFRNTGAFSFSTGSARAYPLIDKAARQLYQFQDTAKVLQQQQDLFGITHDNYDVINQMFNELKSVKEVWDVVVYISSQLDEWKLTLWNDIDVEFIEEQAKLFSREIKTIDKGAKSYDVYIGLTAMLKNFLGSLPLISDLRSPAMRDRHWQKLMKTTGVQIKIDENFKLADLIALNLYKHIDDVETIVSSANKELQMEKSLKTLDETWANLCFEFKTSDNDAKTPLLEVPEELVDTLEDNQVTVQNMIASKFVAHFINEISEWQKQLSNADTTIAEWIDVQRTWMHLEPIFIRSEDIRAQLPEQSELFDGIDERWKELMNKAVNVPKVLEACNNPNLLPTLESLKVDLSKCEKALSEYLDTKRRAFPRFYFISPTDLLDILSQGKNPHAVEKHLSKLFDNIKKLEWTKENPDIPDSENNSTTAIGMYSKELEYIPFPKPHECVGAVENWLNTLVEAMRNTLRTVIGKAVSKYIEMEHTKWILEYPAQVVLVGSQIWWTTDVQTAFDGLEEGNEMAMKEYSKKQNDGLLRLISMIQGNLSKNDAQKVMTLCTIEVHARDIVSQMIRDNVDNSSSFAWQSQLRLRWDDSAGDVFINICDAQFVYMHEYLGCTSRLVITPLTDRCYITLTQSLHLIMGGAPAGPAGTGKTETTKDLGRALGNMVYVFNCSSEMDYYSLGNIFKGLASSGAWGCFDEFNRISIEVLSVVATQVKTVLDAIRAKKKIFDFEGQDIKLVPTCGMFITMNPGYAGRTELPENIKALFRPVSMIVPDVSLICEISLYSQGFVSSRELSQKFCMLYSLNKELLSKQDHYDWGLRAIIAVARTAGNLRRQMIGVSTPRKVN